jgi:peptidoglycan/LPS O-acetylase OafA/YrhL
MTIGTPRSSRDADDQAQWAPVEVAVAAGDGTVRRALRWLVPSRWPLAIAAASTCALTVLSHVWQAHLAANWPAIGPAIRMGIRNGECGLGWEVRRIGGFSSLPEADWSVDVSRSGTSGICGDSWSSAWFGLDPNWSFHRFDLTIAACALVVLAVAAFAESRRGVARGRCRRCGYPIIGASRCPECGQDRTDTHGLSGHGAA